MGATAVRDPGNEVDMEDEACVALPKMWATKMKRAENKRKNDIASEPCGKLLHKGERTKT